MLTSKLARRAHLAVAATIAATAFAAVPAAANAAPLRDQAADEAAITADITADIGPSSATGIETVPPEPLLDACPIGGPSTFEDSWGWARSGGRRHEGVDLIAERGTPVIAVRDGVAQFKNNRLGGRAIWLTTENGDKFYYAHLDRWEGESREVEAGELIGYVGSSGNARGSHLHFETLPGGNVENPYPHTLGACVPRSEELASAQPPSTEPALRSRPSILPRS